MNLIPNLQKKLYGFNETFLLLANLFDQKKMPNKILLSGQKGIGKATLAYHLSNYILSKNEEDHYNLKENEINENNRSYKLVLSNSHPNFFLINLKNQKKNIDIDQVREMINYTNKSSFNSKNKIILIDGIEELNLYSTNALLKIIEEPNEGVIFFLIHDSKKKIFSTLKSRCIKFTLNLKKVDKVKIISSLTENDFLNKLNTDFINYYNTPGYYINFYQYCINNKIDFENTTIEIFLKKLFSDHDIKKNSFIKDNLLNLLELFFAKKIKINHSKNEIYNLYKSFIRKVNNVKKYNLDLETLIIEINSKLINE